MDSVRNAIQKAAEIMADNMIATAAGEPVQGKAKKNMKK